MRGKVVRREGERERKCKGSEARMKISFLTSTSLKKSCEKEEGWPQKFSTTTYDYGLSDSSSSAGNLDQ